MTIAIDPAVDPAQDPRRIRFEKMKEKGGGTYDELMQLIQEFIALGHNPKDPTDAMYAILGITPEFLETMLFTLRTQPMATIDEFSIIPATPLELAPAPPELVPEVVMPTAPAVALPEEAPAQKA